MSSLDANTLRNDFSIAFKEGNLIEIIHEKMEEHGYQNKDNLIVELVILHNEGLINLIDSFKEFKNDNHGFKFFSIRNVLEKALPSINAPVLSVMECALHLVKEAGNDMMAGSLFSPYIDFCSIDNSRATDALELLENNIEWVDLLSPTLVAGSKLNIEHYLNKTIELTCHENIEIRKRAVFALGKLDYSKSPSITKQAIDALEKSCNTETDDFLLSNVIHSAFYLYSLNKSEENRINLIVDSALSKGDDLALHAAAQSFGFCSDSLLDTTLLHLQRVIPKNRGTLNSINCSLLPLLKGKNSTKAIEFLEEFLVKNANELSFELFNSVFFFFTDDKNRSLLNRITTRWFLRGDMVLCNGIRDIVNQFYENDILLSIEPSELNLSNSTHIVFIAKKAIGYLFTHPVTAASIIISLINHTTDIKTINILGGLLFNPLLINYQGKLKDYLITQLDSENKNVKAIVDLVLKESEKYFDDIKSVGDLPELNPSQEQREAYWRYHSRIMSESMKKSEKESSLSSLFTKSVLLYGNKFIMYAEGIGDEEPRRMEMPLHSHSVSVEYPRTEHIDSFGLNYMLRIFQLEQLTS